MSTEEEERMAGVFEHKHTKALSLTLSSCLGRSAFCDSFPIIKALNFPHCRMLDGERGKRKKKQNKKVKWKQRGNELIIMQK